MIKLYLFNLDVRKLLRFATLACLFFVCPILIQGAHAQQFSCDQVLKSAASGDYWRRANGPLFMGIRSNCLQYWAWVRSKLPELSVDHRLLKIGLVAGDPHILNFGDLLINGARKLRLIDLDDAGRGPLIFDFIKFVIASRSMRIGLTTDLLVDAYRQGLNGEDRDRPKEINKLMNISTRKDRERQEKYIEKMVKRDKFDLEEAGLLRISDVDMVHQNAFSRNERYFEQSLSDYEILDRAVRIKTSGGSVGLARFWYLVRNRADQLEVFEFKPLEESGVGQTTPQLPIKQRIEEIMHLFWRQERDPHFDIIDANGQFYFKRPRIKYGIEAKYLLDPENKSIAHDFSLLIAYHMGRMVNLQTDTRDYVSAFNESPVQIRQLIEKLSSLYLNDARQLHSN